MIQVNGKQCQHRDDQYTDALRKYKSNNTQYDDAAGDGIQLLFVGHAFNWEKFEYEIGL